MAKGSSLPPHMAGLGMVTERMAVGTLLQALGTCGGNLIGQSPRSTKQQDRHHRVTRSRNCGTGHMLSFPPGLTARGRERRTCLKQRDLFLSGSG